MSVRFPPRPILLVEDDRDTRELFRLRLRAAGFRVIAVEDGVDALRIVESDRPALVVLDLGLPRLNGRDVQRELAARAETRHIPIVVVTGTNPSGLGPADVACVLRKPVDPEALAASVIACLARAGAGSEPI